MKLLVLGSGTCLGSPPGVLERMPPLFLVTWGEHAVLFDCSEGARTRLSRAGFDPQALRHVAVSHPHADHAVLPPFFQARSCEVIHRGTATPLDLYLPRASADALPELLRWHQPEDAGALPTRWQLVVHGLSDGDRRAIGDAVLSAHAVHHGHGKNPALAYRLEGPGFTFAYSGDTGLCDGIVRAARGADLFVCEASSRIGVDMAHGYGHLTPRQAADVAQDASAKRLLLTHHTGLDTDAAMLADARSGGFDGELRVAHDGDAWVVD